MNPKYEWSCAWRFVAVAALIALVVGCAQTKDHNNRTAAVPPSEGAFGNPSATTLGVGGIPDEQRDKTAEVARQYVSKFLTWSDDAVYVVRKREVGGWYVDVCRITGHGISGKPKFNYKERRTVTLNRKEHVVGFYSSGGPTETFSPGPPYD